MDAKVRAVDGELSRGLVREISGEAGEMLTMGLAVK
jgi:hypothetical protein